MRAIADFIQPLILRSLNQVIRGEVARAVETTKMRGLQVTLREGDDPTDDTTEHFEPYGFTSAPKAGAEALVVTLGGAADLPVVIVAADRRYRLLGLANGEVAIHDDQGQKVHIKRDRVVVQSALVELGEGATKGVARNGDTVTSNATIDPVFWAYLAALPTPPVPPESLTCEITSSSAKIKAVD
jgi:phage baseplate assembly protein V